MAIDRYRFGNNLYAVLKARGMKQSELAEALGVYPQYVSRWMNGSRIPNTEMLLKIANLLNVSVDRLTRGMYIDEKESED